MPFVYKSSQYGGYWGPVDDGGISGVRSAVVTSVRYQWNCHNLSGDKLYSISEFSVHADGSM